MASSINISDETKKDFDDVQIELISIKGKRLSQDETLKEILDLWIQVNVSKTLKVVEA